ncbi:2-amino-4-hydroxy-6-hydroxymethyldihydropteridine diphosphokinase [Mesorhizobium sp. LHD-90]|uniref:2-amino-4-hydroxy-6- hydroxymethyldihydropteridine diphosphokinase n=1 Tax=Mesorhizobium sp. LHD-90 TaxID=3071414 RepID=UPI0027DFE7A3|nr:2-amino-4-hydroxy-6-hydroxymethyldihydropteridine diphosphokinase [Mesorhizobium sp. LHD-90]MDQ6437838.1 2-amino-4-hydroxy-6-hydroxymethyldihydropteridine diphosphokinase [Mesorhizobium sp. LHD-90]
MPDHASECVYLSLGGNLGDPARAMGEALRLLDAEPSTKVVAVSALYRTPPWGKLDQPDFLNIAAAVETDKTPRAFLDLCLDVERRLKRERRERWGPRLIDIDILMFGRRRVSEPGLDLPHPRMTERAFVLVPLAEIAPDLEIAGQPAGEWLRALDVSDIERQPSGRDWWKAQAAG